jgi:hypothetical protein
LNRLAGQILRRDPTARRGPLRQVRPHLVDERTYLRVIERLGSGTVALSFEGIDERSERRVIMTRLGRT